MIDRLIDDKIPLPLCLSLSLLSFRLVVVYFFCFLASLSRSLSSSRQQSVVEIWTRKRWKCGEKVQLNDKLAGMNGHQIVWYCVVCAFVTVAVVAIVFAILAWNDSQARRPHQRLERSNIVARGEMFADGDILTKSNLRVDGEAQVRGKSRLSRAALQSLSLDEVRRIVGVGPIVLDKEHSAYRIDTPGAQMIHIQLPAISDVPLQVFVVMVSRLGANNTITIEAAPNDLLVDGAPTSQPVHIMPVIAGQPDHVLLHNDGLSTWFTIAHTKPQSFPNIPPYTPPYTPLNAKLTTPPTLPLKFTPFPPNL